MSTQHVCTRLRSIENRLTVAVLTLGATVKCLDLGQCQICDELPDVGEVGVIREL